MLSLTSRTSRTSSRTDRTTVEGELRAQRGAWWRLFGQAILVTLCFGVFALVWSPHPAPATVAVYLVLAAAIVIRPIVGVFAITLLTLIGDAKVAGWYPFAKNLSSRESISFVSDALTVTPIEVLLGVTIIAWMLRSYATHTWRFRTGALGVPMMVFGGIVFLAIARAMAGAGDNRVAIFEGRAMLYLPLLYLLIVNLFENRRQYAALFVVAICGLFVHSLIAIDYYGGLADHVRAELEDLTEHSASVHIAALLVIVLATWVIPGCTGGLRLFVLVAAVPTTVVFVLSQRRSGAIALAVGIILVLVVLGRLRPHLLLFLVPVLVVGTAAYVVAFWNTTGSLGLGAQAFKSVFASDQLEEVDFRSNLYREFEAYDVWFTIHASPLTGVGFGNPFYQPLPLPFLPGFEFRHYIPHNNFLWVWLKLGVVGFATMLFLVARTVQFGARSVIRIGRGNDAALMMGAVAYVVMYVVFTYVDIAWDARSMVFLALAAAWCADRLDVGAPEPAPSSPPPEAAVDRPGVPTDA